MLTRFLLSLLAKERVRKTIGAAIISTAFLLFVMLYAVTATPWSMLSGWFDTLFQGGTVYDNIDWSGYFAAQTHGAYIEDFNQFQQKFEASLTPHYQNIWKKVYDKCAEKADEMARKVKKEDCPLQPCTKVSLYPENEALKGHAIVYSTFSEEKMQEEENPIPCERIDSADIKDGIDRIRPNDGAAVLSVYNNVGLEWDSYKENDSQWHVLQEMNVPKGPNGEYIGELASVDGEKLVKLIEKNIPHFFKGHIPKDDGRCFPNIAPTIKQVEWDKLPRKYKDLKTILGADGKPMYQEPYTGIYFSTKVIPQTSSNPTGELPPELRDLANGVESIQMFNTDGGEIGGSGEEILGYTLHIDYTVIGFVEYRGYSWFEEHLHFDEFPKARTLTSEAYRNACYILGKKAEQHKKLGEYSTGLDPLLKEDIKKREEGLSGPREYIWGEEGTGLPVYQENGEPFWITAHFHDPNYVKDLTHKGTDFGCGMNTPVHITTDGQIVKVGHDWDGFGNYAVAYQGKNQAGDQFYFIYAHMNEVQVREGQYLKRGDQIGLSGATGFVTGPHLHYECRVVRADGRVESIDTLSEEGGLHYLRK